MPDPKELQMEFLHASEELKAAGTSRERRAKLREVDDILDAALAVGAVALENLTEPPAQQ